MTTPENLSIVFKHVSRILYLGIVLCLILSCTQKKKEMTSQSIAEAEIISDTQTRKLTNEILSQETAWASALVDVDLNYVESIMHDDFRLIRAYGNAPPISKKTYLGMKGMSVSSAEVTSVEITAEMDSIVVARTTWTLDWEQEGVGKLPPHFDVIDIWKKNKDGIWQILSRVSQIVDEPYSDK